MAKTLAWTTAVAGAMFAFAALPARAAGEFDGVTVNVMTQTGAIQEPLQRRAPEFEKMTGAKINIIAVPFSDLYQKLLTDWASGTNSVDAAVFAPQWMVDYVSGGYLEDLGPRIAKDKALQWDQIAPFFRDFSANFEGKTYLIPLDGDFHMLYYRTDVFEKAGLKPPTTWDEYLADAKALNGKDFNGDGSKGFGSCIAKKRNAQSYWFVTDIAGSMIQSKGTAQGTFFDTKDMKPLIDNDAFRKALDFLKELGKYGPPNELNMDVSDTRPLFVSGKCALNLDWGDVGVLAIDPKSSKVIDKTGAAITPGSKEVLNWGTGKLEACTKENCPYAIDGVNHAPYAAFGGWSGGINAKAKDKVKDAAFAFLSYVGQPAQSDVDVTIGKTGFNPYRTVAVHLQRHLEESRNEQGRRRLLSRRDQGEPRQSEHDPGPAHPAEPEISAGRARRGDLAVPGRRNRRGSNGQGRRRRLERSQPADRRREPAEILQGLARHPAVGRTTRLPPARASRRG